MSEESPADTQSMIGIFGAKQIRRAWVDGQWYFSVVDVIGALTGSASPPKYWDAMKRREKASSGVDLSTFCRKVGARWFPVRADLGFPQTVDKRGRPRDTTVGRRLSG